MRNYTLLVNSPNSELEDRLRHYEGEEKGIPRFMHPYGRGLDPESVIAIDLYKNGSQIHWPVEGPTNGRKVEMPERKASLEQSKKSRLNAAWTIGNSDTEWQFMTTFTYPQTYHDSLTYSDVVSHRNRITSNVRKNYQGQHFAWILEFTKKGAPHFHFFWGHGPLADQLKTDPRKTVKRNGQETMLSRGKGDEDLVRWWSLGADDGSQAYARFQHGGITEYLRHPEGAAAYVAKEAGKREQKKAPWHVSAWWGSGPNSIKPILEESIEMRVDDYIEKYGEVMLSKLFERADRWEQTESLLRG